MSTDNLEIPNDASGAEDAPVSDTAVIEAPVGHFTAFDRCDRDATGVEQAWVRFENPATGLDMLLCYHCANIHADELGEQGFIITADDRDILIAQEKTGGPAL